MKYYAADYHPWNCMCVDCADRDCGDLDVCQNCGAYFEWLPRQRYQRCGPCRVGLNDPHRALAIEAGTDETLQAAQPVGQERGPAGNAQSLSHKYSMKEEPNGN